MGNCINSNPYTYNETVVFVPPITRGRVIKVYDGDTVTIASKLPYYTSPVYRFSIRLNGIDTPEIRGSNEDEKEVALLARAALYDKIFGKVIILKNCKTEKYGRILADVFLDKININTWMLENRFAVKYDGGKKISPDSWSDYHKNNRA